MDKLENKIRETKALYKNLGWATIFTHIRFFTAPYQELEKLIPKSGFIIDFGCGYGIFSNFLGLTGPEREILGIDLDSKKIKVAPRGIKNVKFQKADITKIKLKKVDVILLIHVLHHLDSFEAQERLLADCREKIGRKGMIIIAEVDKKPLIKYVLGLVADRFLYPKYRIFYRFPDEFLKLFTKFGFKGKILRLNKGRPFAHVIYLVKKK